MRNAALASRAWRQQHIGFQQIFQVSRLQGERAIVRLPAAYGYYVDQAQWDEAADLLAHEATYESE